MPEDKKEIPYIKFELRNEFGEVTKVYKESDSGYGLTELVDEFKLFLEYLTFQKENINDYFVSDEDGN